jgi:hypothetical protein
MARPQGGRRADLARNAAYFFGAFGCTLGLFGAALGMAALVAHLLPGAAASLPDWVYTVGMVTLLLLVIGLWPALDWLIGRAYRLGAALLAVLGLGVGGVGSAVLVLTSWALVGWLALSAVPLLLGAAWLVLRGQGTEPLNWRSLRTAEVTRVERRLERYLALVSGVLGVSWLVVIWSGNLALGLSIGCGLLVAGGFWLWTVRG